VHQFRFVSATIVVLSLRGWFEVTVAQPTGLALKLTITLEVGQAG